MGGTTVSCTQHMLSDKKFQAVCYDGLMSTSHAQFGIMSVNLDKQTYCQEEAIWKVDANKDKIHCTDYMDKSVIND
jgi:hypothetical protein